MGKLSLPICSVPHTAGNTKGGSNSRQNGQYGLNNKFPSFFFHNSKVLNFNVNVYGNGNGWRFRIVRRFRIKKLTLSLTLTLKERPEGQLFYSSASPPPPLPPVLVPSPSGELGEGLLSGSSTTPGSVLVTRFTSLPLRS